MKPIYLDYSATTPLRPEVREAMLPLLGENFGNPSSIHTWGRSAKAKLEEARSRIAALIGASAGELYFTRGGTEADNLAILGRSRHVKGGGVVCSSIEHKAVLMAARAAEAEGSPLHELPVDGEGVVSETDLRVVLDPSLAVVSVMWANNEIGSVQPVERLAELCDAASVAFHTDAVQAFGKLDVRIDRAPISMLSISAHKLGGPKGVGALYVRKGTDLEPLIYGGGHERGLRAGTEDIAGVVGFATAAELAIRDRDREMKRLEALRNRLQDSLIENVPDIRVNGAGAARLPTILNVSIPGADSEILLVMLDLEGIAVSSGSACSSGGLTTSHVLTAIGLPFEMAGPSVRFSLGRETTEDEIDRAIAVIPPLMERLRATVS